jgi:hypothetical protein
MSIKNKAGRIIAFYRKYDKRLNDMSSLFLLIAAILLLIDAIFYWLAK